MNTNGRVKRQAHACSRMLRHERQTVAVALAECQHHRAQPRGGFEKKYTAILWKHPLPRSLARSTSTSTTKACQSSGARGLTVSPTSGRRSESRGAVWCRTSTLCRSSHSSTSLSRSWWTRWWKCGRSPTPLCLTSRRSSKCPRSFLMCFHGGLCFASRSWRNSWWKCRWQRRSSWCAAQTSLASHGVRLWVTRARTGGVYWWMTGTRHVQWTPPAGFTASPGRYINIGQG